jgi:hypothetical protein
VQRIKGENEMKIKTADAKDAALDWLVAKCEGVKVEKIMELSLWSSANWHKYSTNWAQGGPIIEREKINYAWLTKQDLGMEPEHYCVAHSDGSYARYGPTPLVAAMRCYVASKLGDEVEIPKELT